MSWQQQAPSQVWQQDVSYPDSVLHNLMELQHNNADATIVPFSTFNPNVAEKRTNDFGSEHFAFLAAQPNSTYSLHSLKGANERENLQKASIQSANVQNNEHHAHHQASILVHHDEVENNHTQIIGYAQADAFRAQTSAGSQGAVQAAPAFTRSTGEAGRGIPFKVPKLRHADTCPPDFMANYIGLPSPPLSGDSSRKGSLGNVLDGIEGPLGDDEESKAERRKVQNRLAQRRRRLRNTVLSLHGEKDESLHALLEPDLQRRRKKSSDFVSAEEKIEWRRFQNREAKRRYRERSKSEASISLGLTGSNSLADELSIHHAQPFGALLAVQKQGENGFFPGYPQAHEQYVPAFSADGQPVYINFAAANGNAAFMPTFTAPAPESMCVYPVSAGGPFALPVNLPAGSFIQSPTGSAGKMFVAPGMQNLMAAMVRGPIAVHAHANGHGQALS